MPFKAFLARMTKLYVLMEQLAASFTMKAIIAVIFLMVFVVKIQRVTVAPMQQLAVILVAVLFLTLFVVDTTVATMELNVIYNMGVVSGHNFCLC